MTKQTECQINHLSNVLTRKHDHRFGEQSRNLNQTSRYLGPYSNAVRFLAPLAPVTDDTSARATVLIRGCATTFVRIYYRVELLLS